MTINDSSEEENERCKPIIYDSDAEGTDRYFEMYFEQQEHAVVESSRASENALTHVVRKNSLNYHFKSMSEAHLMNS